MESQSNLTDLISNWFAQIQSEVSDEIYILPWSPSSTLPPVLQTDMLPNNLFVLANYFTPLRAPTAKFNFRTCTQIHLGSNNDFADQVGKSNPIMAQWYSSMNNSALCRKSLDHSANPRHLGMLTYSGNFVNPMTVKQELNKALTTSAPHLVNKIGVKLSNVNNKHIPCEIKRTPDSAWINRSNMVIQFEADNRDVVASKKALYSIYNKRNTSTFCFRYTPSPHISLLTENGRNKYNLNWKKHEKDISELRGLTADDISLLDSPNADGLSLRDILMGFTHTNGSKLFHHIDTVSQWEDPSGLTKRAVVFPENHAEAQSILSLLVSSTKQQYGASADSWFTDEALARHADVSWSQELGFITKDDLEMENTLHSNVRAIEGSLQSLLTGLDNEAQTSLPPLRADDKSFFSHGSQLDPNANSAPTPKQTSISDVTASTDDTHKDAIIEDLKKEIARLQCTSPLPTDSLPNADATMSVNPKDIITATGSISDSESHGDEPATLAGGGNTG